MNKLINADWTDAEFAKANDELNSGYFKTDEYKSYASFFKIKEALNYILQKQAGPLSLLDIGCGTGWQAEYMYREKLLENIKYTGLDISQHMCDRAIKNCPYGNFIVHNILEEKLSEMFDIVFEAAVIELVLDWKLMLRKMIDISNSWIILHRLMFTDSATYTEQTVTYNEKPDIRCFVNTNEVKEILKEKNFVIEWSDVWRKDPFKIGTFIARKQNG